MIVIEEVVLGLPSVVETDQKEKPIAFTGQMMRAILRRCKTQTRRVIKPQSSHPDYRMTTLLSTTGDERNVGKHEWAEVDEEGFIGRGDCVYFSCPYAVGDILVPRSTWAVLPKYDDVKPSDIDPAEVGMFFWFDGSRPKPDGAGKSRPGRFLPKTFWHYMPRLKVTAVHEERMGFMPPGDIMAEGVSVEGGSLASVDAWIHAWIDLWNSINAKRGYPYSPDLRVWVFEFELCLELMSVFARRWVKDE